MNERWHYLYNTAAWKRLRAHQLRKHPLCRFCLDRKLTTAATVVDHREPHKGNPVLFFDENNLDSLCAPCHDSTKQKQELNGHRPGADERGQPLDPTHPWNQ